jgi:hypothetical protein
MNRKFVVCLLAFVSLSADSLFGSAACAQDTPKFDVFAGYSYVRENPLLASMDLTCTLAAHQLPTTQTTG